MLDLKTLHVRGGPGGDGGLSFIREAHRPQGGPDGGDGGHGGPVLVRADVAHRTLSHLRRVGSVDGGNGVAGKSQERTGAKGGASTISVPEGTQVWEVTEDGTNVRLLADLISAGQVVVVAEGGVGGRGNTRFKSAINRTPKLAEVGEEGEEKNIKLEVKLLADVALVGPPNAGKSTLLRQISRAKPTVGDYPFTTIEPVMGVVERNGRVVVFLDVPGLIEGAHLGRGLGLEFLRHVERGAIIVTLLDGSSAAIGGDYQAIRHELVEYGARLEDKPELVVINKVDRTDVRASLLVARAELAEVSGHSPIEISGATGEGVDLLINRILEMLGTQDKEPQADQPRVSAAINRKGVRETVKVWNKEGVFVVSHGPAERLIRRVNLEDWETKMQLHQELGRLGVLRMLRNAGVVSGDTVRIGSVEMEWE